MNWNRWLWLGLGMGALSACGGGGSAESANTVPVVSTTSPKYNQTMLISVSGKYMQGTPTAESTACSTLKLETEGALAPTATSANFTCQINSVGNQSVTIRSGAGNVLVNYGFQVPLPQVSFQVKSNDGTDAVLVVELDADKVPNTVKNFLSYVYSGYYQGTIFHRYQKDFVLQGGGYTATSGSLDLPVKKAASTPIALELNASLHNIQGTVAMARTSDLNSATSEFFVNLGNNTYLDTAGGGYAVFGKIVGDSGLMPAINRAECKVMATFLPQTLGCVPSPYYVISAAAQTL